MKDSPLVKAHLRESFPDKVLPRGVFSATAKQFGISRQAVSQVAKRQGYVLAPITEAALRRKMNERYKEKCLVKKN